MDFSVYFSRQGKIAIQFCDTVESKIVYFKCFIHSFYKERERGKSKIFRFSLKNSFPNKVQLSPSLTIV